MRLYSRRFTCRRYAKDSAYAGKPVSEDEFDSPSKELSEDELDRLPKTLSFSCLDVVMLITSVIFYVSGMVLDSSLAYKLYHKGTVWYFGLTVAFIVVPRLTMTAYSLRWYLVDMKIEETPKASRMEWCLRAVCLLLQLAPALRYVDSLRFGLRFKQTNGKERETFYKWMTFEDADVAFLRLFQAVMQAAPQLVLQIYILTGPNPVEDDTTEMTQMILCLWSLGLISWSLAAQQRTLRISLPKKTNPNWPATIVQTLWYFFIVGSRMLALGLFASQLPIAFAVVCAVRWVIMTSWLQTMKTNFCDTKVEEVIYRCCMGITFIFCYINPEDSPTRWRYFFYYLYTFTENATLIGIWYNWVVPDLWYRDLAILTVFLGFLVGLVFMMLYYLLLHPTGNITISGWCNFSRKASQNDDQGTHCLSTPESSNGQQNIQLSPLRELKVHPLGLHSSLNPNKSQENGNGFRSQSDVEENQYLEMLNEVDRGRAIGTPV